jgi:NitT/TauT family transport system permease protein
LRRAPDALRLGTWGPPVVAFGLVLVIWQVLAVHNHFLLPTLGSVVSQLVHDPGTYLANGGDTLAEALPGVAISYAFALLLAIAMVQSRLVTRAILPLAVVLNVTPLIAIAPALVVAFSFGRTPRVALTALITFFPALIYSLTGLRAADPQALEVLQTLHASRWETLWRLRLPSSLPYQFAAARVVVPLAIIGAAVSEMVSPGVGSGLGWLINTASTNSQLDIAWAGIATLAALGLVMMAIVVVTEDRVLRWRGFK